MARLELASPVPKTGMLLLHHIFQLKRDASLRLLILTMSEYEWHNYFMKCVLEIDLPLSYASHAMNERTMFINSCM